MKRHSLCVQLVLVPCLASAVAESDGCTYRRVVHDGWGDFKQMGDPGPGHENDPSEGGIGQTTWAVLLASFEGPKQTWEAKDLIARVQLDTVISDIWMRQVGDKTNVYRGRYADASDPRALRDLKETKMVRVEGEAMFTGAAIVPITKQGEVVTDPLNLKRYAGQGLFTLQIGYYDDSYGENYQEACEEAVRALRETGEEAFFYHGPHRSHVMVGLFSHADFVEREANEGVWVQAYGPRIKELQEKYPYNLGNGRTEYEVVAGRRGDAALPSFVVPIK